MQVDDPPPTMNLDNLHNHPLEQFLGLLDRLNVKNLIESEPREGPHLVHHRPPQALHHHRPRKVNQNHNVLHHNHNHNHHHVQQSQVWYPALKHQHNNHHNKTPPPHRDQLVMLLLEWTQVWYPGPKQQRHPLLHNHNKLNDHDQLKDQPNRPLDHGVELHRIAPVTAVTSRT